MRIGFLRKFQLYLVIVLAVSSIISFSFFRIPQTTLDLYSNATNLWNGGEVYHSEEVFRIDYKNMLRDFKIYSYFDGEGDVYDYSSRRVWGKYASEGYFFKNIRETNFGASGSDDAHLFFIPVSCYEMNLKVPSYKNMASKVKNYVEGLILKYPFWNKTLGSDHFILTCHETDLEITQGVPMLVKNSIRAVCASSYSSGFIPHKDFAIPKVMQPFTGPPGGNDMPNRTILGYWAGRSNTDLRKTLVEIWRDDTELDIQNQTVHTHRTMDKFYRAKFCICPAGSNHISSRITTAIHYGCVPVILGDRFDLPFNDILEWKKFSVLLEESDVYRLKHILKAKAGTEFRMLHENLIKVQRHFQWNAKPDLTFIVKRKALYL